MKTRKTPLPLLTTDQKAGDKVAGKGSGGSYMY